jgi:hypothetical protein
MNQLMHVHAKPVSKIRLSNHYPKLLVTCGYEGDCFFKLFNVGTKSADDSKEKAEPLNMLQTSQLRHKQMA